MNFIVHRLIPFMFFGLLVGVIGGPAMILLYGIIYVFVCTCLGEYEKTKTPQGRQRIQKEIERERKIEQYWGTIDYTNKK